MKSFKEHIESEEGRKELIDHHEKLSKFHYTKMKEHETLANSDHKHNLEHRMASYGHNDASGLHNNTASMLRMRKDDLATDFMHRAEKSSNAANNRSDSIV